RNVTGVQTCALPICSFHRRPPEGFSLLPALDLHVLGIPPAFVLSQDQTLHKMVCFMFSSPMKTLSFKIKVLTRFKHVECINIRLSLLDIYCCLCSVFKQQINNPILLPFLTTTS